MENREAFSLDEMNIPDTITDRAEFRKAWEKELRAGVRPKITKNFKIPEFIEICERCWHTDPSQRPSLQSILADAKNILSNIVTANGLQTAEAAEFWKNSFGGRITVELDEFLPKFYEFVDLRKPLSSLSTKFKKFEEKTEILKHLFISGTS